MNNSYAQCERQSNNCPSKLNCKRHQDARSFDFPAAALNYRREAGANACDMVIWINGPVTTFAVQQVADAFGIDADTLEEVTE